MRVELPVGFGDSVGGEQGVLLSVRHHLMNTGCVYLAVDDDVRHVYPCGPNSLAMDCASALKPNLPTASAENLALPRSAAEAPVSRVVPRPASTIAGNTSRAA